MSTTPVTAPLRRPLPPHDPRPVMQNAVAAAVRAIEHTLNPPPADALSPSAVGLQVALFVAVGQWLTQSVIERANPPPPLPPMLRPSEMTDAELLDRLREMRAERAADALERERNLGAWFSDDLERSRASPRIIMEDAVAAAMDAIEPHLDPCNAAFCYGTPATEALRTAVTEAVGRWLTRSACERATGCNIEG